MSTPQTVTGKEQETSSQAPPSLPTQQTRPAEQFAPVQPFPQPPRPPRPQSRYWIVGALVALLLVMAMSVGALLLIPLTQRPASQVTPTPTSPGAQMTPTAPTTPATPTPGTSDTTPTPAQGVPPGPQPGPPGVSDPAYWETFLGIQPGVNKVENVSFAHIMDTTSLQALVTVRYTGTDARLDVYVFTTITSAHPKQVFKLTGLVKGDAKISGYNTVMTAQVDQNSSLNKGKSLSAMKPDLFREFNWSSEEGTLVQTAFPGIFPDLTRYQAEADQARIHTGQDTWKNDPQQVAKALVPQFLDWQRPSTTKLLKGGGSRDVSATVRVQETPVQGAPSQGPSIKVTLSRLEGNTHNFWVVIAVEDDTMLTLTNIDARQRIASPVILEGTGAAFEAVIGRAVVYDHLYNDIGHARVMGITAGMGTSAYSTRVVYTSSFRSGVQEGIVAVYENNGGISDEIYTAVLVKVLLDPEPGVALGPLPGPDAQSNPAYWNSFLKAPPNTSIADRVTFGNLLGKPTLQAMVVAHEIVGGGPLFRSVFVFDKITDSKPKLLFSIRHLLHGDAQISGYSTIMTAEVDLNSPINKGKPDSQVTTDLYREFQWSQSKGTFVQVAFPGMYPDLTRWQAEVDQAAVSQGQDTWKLDAVKTTQKMFAALLTGGKETSVAKLVSGGGTGDLTAVVNVTFPPSGSTAIPVTQVTLSRLEGNPNGIWELTSVGSNWLFVYTPKSGTTITSPLMVTGFGPQFEGQIGVVYILNHLYQKIQVGDNFAMGSGGFSPPSKFSHEVRYTSSFQGGAQEGIVELVHAGGANFDFGAVMVKVLLSA